MRELTTDLKGCKVSFGRYLGRLVVLLHVFLLVSPGLRAQNFSQPQADLSLRCNTGVNVNGTAPIGNWTDDPNWDVQTIGGQVANQWFAAKAMTVPVQPTPNCINWSPNAAPSQPYNQWITHPLYNCNGIQGNYSCLNTPTAGLVFRRQFNLPGIQCSTWISECGQAIGSKA
jgi:hypothetical protein